MLGILWVNLLERIASNQVTLDDSGGCGYGADQKAFIQPYRSRGFWDPLFHKQN